jgi:hypothetical protein
VRIRVRERRVICIDYTYIMFISNAFNMQGMVERRERKRVIKRE